LIGGMQVTDIPLGAREATTVERQVVATVEVRRVGSPSGALRYREKRLR